MPAVTRNRATQLFWRLHPVVAEGASFAEYESRTTRRIPVVVLEPVQRA